MLIDFSNIFAFAATLNITFVAVSHTKGYTNLLANYVFEFINVINNYFSDKKKIISLDLNSLKTMPDVVVGKGSTLKKKQELIREAEKLSEDIISKEEKICQKIDVVCTSKKFSMYSLIMFLYCIVGMFSGSWKDDFSVIGFWNIFTIFILLECVIIAIIKKERSIWAIVGFIVSLISSLILSNISYLNSLFFSSNKLYILFSACLPFLFFVIFFFITWCKRNDIKKEMNKDFEEVDAKIKELDSGLNILNEIKGLSSNEPN